MSLKIIGLCGFKGSGKSTAADFLCEMGYEKRALAAPLKEACQTIFHLSDEQLYTSEGKEKFDPRWSKTPRKIFQLFGTEVGRTFSSDVWIESLQQYIEKDGHNKWVIDDVRFPNEAEAIRKMGGVVIGIDRPEVTPKLTWRDHLPRWVARLLRIDQLHPSERTMLEAWDSMVDATISNNKTLFELEYAVRSLAYVYAEDVGLRTYLEQKVRELNEQQ